MPLAANISFTFLSLPFFLRVLELPQARHLGKAIKVYLPVFADTWPPPLVLSATIHHALSSFCIIPCHLCTSSAFRSISDIFQIAGALLLQIAEMNRGKIRASSRPPRHRNFPNQKRQNEGPKKVWASPKRMATAKSQMNDMRQITVAAAAGDYRGPPPADRDLIEVSGVDVLLITLVFFNGLQLLK